MTDEMLKRALDAYRDGAEAAVAERLRFLEGLCGIQAEIEAADREYEAPDEDTAREAVVTGQPIFLSAPPAVPRDEYVAAVERVAEYVVSAAGLSEEQSAALAAADLPAALTEERLAGAVTSTDRFAAEVAEALGEGLEPAVVTYVLLSALVPFLTGPSAKALAAAGSLDPGGSELATCPVCGSPAAMGRMGESTALQGGTRTLWCGLCHAEWGYARIRCVRCGTRNPDKLRYTYVEGDSAHRLHLCDECHGYARFVFVDDVDKPVSMVVEDTVATMLDAIAHDMGYTAAADGIAENG